MRIDGRENSELREIDIETGYQQYPDGSVLITWGETRVLCCATVDYKVPFFMAGSGNGWITAEYGMLPGSGNKRIRRERGSVIKGRTQEIQRLIGRSLRQSVHLDKLGERTITIDCDVLTADGGTRVASIVGGMVALRLALKRQMAEDKMKRDPFKGFVSALSLGIVGEDVILDLCYEEDSQAIIDMNLVALENGELVELQATAEDGTVPLDTVTAMSALALDIILKEIIPLQRDAAGD